MPVLVTFFVLFRILISFDDALKSSNLVRTELEYSNSSLDRDSLKTHSGVQNEMNK